MELFHGFVYILKSLTNLPTFLVKPKEPFIFTDLFTFLQKFDECFCNISRQTEGTFHFHGFYVDFQGLFKMPKNLSNWKFFTDLFTFLQKFDTIFCEIKRSLHDKLVKLKGLNAFVYILQITDFCDVFWRYQYLEEHFESSRISSSSWIQVTLVSARKTLLEIKSTAIDTCLTDRRNEGQKVLLTLTFNSKFSKVDFAKSGSKLTLPKKPDKPAKNPDNTECEIPRIPIQKNFVNFFFVYFDLDKVVPELAFWWFFQKRQNVFCPFSRVMIGLECRYGLVMRVDFGSEGFIEAVIRTEMAEAFVSTIT